jgi:hypothetical protein
VSSSEAHGGVVDKQPPDMNLAWGHRAALGNKQRDHGQPNTGNPAPLGAGEEAPRTSGVVS